MPMRHLAKMSLQDFEIVLTTGVKSSSKSRSRSSFSKHTLGCYQYIFNRQMWGREPCHNIHLNNTFHTHIGETHTNQLLVKCHHQLVVVVVTIIHLFLVYNRMLSIYSIKQIFTYQYFSFSCSYKTSHIFRVNVAEVLL